MVSTQRRVEKGLECLASKLGVVSETVGRWESGVVEQQSGP